MKIGFVVNNIATEDAQYTTTRLTLAALHRGHKTYTFGVGDFVYAPDGSIHALARSPNESDYDSLEKLMEDLQDEEQSPERVCVDSLDVLMLRNDPSEDVIERPWAPTSAILFGQLATGRDVIVVNDPVHLASAINKTYFQHFPEKVRPRACISRNEAEIKKFLDDEQGKAVIKPLQGSGGHNVFVIGGTEKTNVNQMIEAVLRDGYCIAQEYLPAATEGDVRLFVMNGRPLEKDGKYAAFRRVNKTGDARSNMHSGGQAEPVDMTDEILSIVEIVRPKLVRDGMFLVGLDICGDKLMEINVFSPGGLASCLELTGVDFAEVVIADLERKVKHKAEYDRKISNVELATL